MIEIRKINGKNWICSVELYDLLGREKTKYRRWARRYITMNCSLQSPGDYFLHKEAKRGWLNPHRTEFYLSIPVAIGICIREGTITSRNIRLSIQEDLKNQITKNYIKR